MSLAPDVSRVLELIARAGNPEYHQMTARAAHEERAGALGLPPDPLASVRDVSIPGGAGPASVITHREPQKPTAAPSVRGSLPPT